MRPPDEVERWRRAVDGDGEAFASLFDTHQGRVYRHALRLTDGSVQDAEDVAPGAFLELWRRRDSVRIVDGSVLPWLQVTTTNLALNQRRGLRRHRRLLDRLPRREDHAPAADLRTLDLAIDPGLLAAIRRLSDVDQTLVALVAVEDLPLRSAGQAPGLTEAAARSRWQRIRSRLAHARTTNPATPRLPSEQVNS